MSRILHWKDLEKAVQDQCEAYQRKLPFAWLRLTDSRAAGNFVKKQPSDFLVTYDGSTTLIEAKFSDKHESLRNCFSSAVDSNQTASAFIWTRAKANYIFIFYSSLNCHFEVWDGLYCREQRSIHKRLSATKRRLYGHIGDALGTEILRLDNDGQTPVLLRSASGPGT